MQSASRGHRKLRAPLPPGAARSGVISLQEWQRDLKKNDALGKVVPIGTARVIETVQVRDIGRFLSTPNPLETIPTDGGTNGCPRTEH
jgi:hypothetical protein